MVSTWEDFDPQADIRRNIRDEMVRRGLHKRTLALHLGLQPREVAHLLSPRFGRTWTSDQVQRVAEWLGRDAKQLTGTSTFPPTER